MKKKKHQRRSRTQKFIKFLAAAMVSIALILLSLHAFIEIFERELFDLLIHHMEKTSGGLYRITYDQVHLDFFNGTVQVKNLSIDLDPKTLQHIKAGTQPKKTLIKTSLSQLSIEGISFFTLAFDNTLRIDRFSLRDGKLAIFKFKNRKKKPGGTASKPVKLIIRQVAIDKMSFKILEPDRPEPILDLPGISLRLTRLKLFPFFSFESGAVTLVEPNFTFPNGFYQLRTKTLKLSKSPLSSTLALRGFELRPRYKEYRFARRKGYQTDRIALKIDDTIFNGIRFGDFFKNQYFYCRGLTVGHPQLEIFRDKNVPRRARVQPKKSPQQLFRELAFKLRIEQINISNGYIALTEHAKNEKRPGKLFFNELQAELKHIANDPAWLKKKIPAAVTASTRVMGKGIFKINLVVPIYHEKNRFSLGGSLGKMDLRPINSILQPNAHIRIRSGIIDTLHFSVQCDNDLAKGTMKLSYRDLKISVLKVKEGGAHQEKKITSFLANVIIRQQNPRPGKPLREGRIFYKREAPVSFLAYVGKALLTGVRSSIGL